MNIRCNILLLFTYLLIQTLSFNTSRAQNNSGYNLLIQANYYSAKGDSLNNSLPDSAAFYFKKGIQLLDDSLKVKSDKNIFFNKAKILLKIGQIFFQQSKYQFCSDYYSQALETAKLSENDSIIAECIFNIGEYCLENGKYSNAINSYLEANKLYEKNANRDGMFWSNIGMGIVFRELGNKDLSLQHYEKAKSIAEDENNKLHVAISENNIANLYNQIGNYETALKFLMNALKSFKEYGDKKFISDCYENFGNVYKELNDFSRAISYYKLSTEIAEKIDDKYRLLSRYANLANSFASLNDNENALMYFSKTLELAQSIGDKARMSEIYIMLSNFYKQNKDLKLARNYLDKSLNISTEIGDSVSIVSALNKLSELYFIEKDYKNSLKFSTDAFSISKKKNLLKLVSESSKNMSQAAASMNDFKSAYNYLDIHKTAKDSLLNLEKLKVLEDTEAKYKLEQLENEKNKVENEALIAESQLQNRNLLVLILGILIVASLFMFGTYFVKKRNEKKEAREKASQLTKKIDLLNSQLNIKNRELTAKALVISSNNKTLMEIIDSIDEILNNQTDNKEKLKKLKNKLQSISEDESWQDFLQHFEEVHPSYFKKLTDKYSDLTSGELKICAFLKMNLNTKEIAQITNQTAKSIEVARTRIRKKLNVEHGESLTQAIHKL
ncbi:MAG: tetratricopeptide repeat protein [Ignavibacteriae bacterium]|nr:tetratricopeptide repeat protein [Ignavibacteriota bacterium]